MRKAGYELHEAHRGDLLIGATWGRRTIRSDALGQLGTRHMAEIEAAREQGYSWPQIERQAQAMWTESGEWSDRWSLSVIEDRYRRMKKENKEV